MQDRFSDEDRHATIATPALSRAIDYSKKRTFHFSNPSEMRYVDGKHAGSQHLWSFQTTLY